jgi:hypothetical protein
MSREKLKLPLTSALRQEQTQFASSSSNRGDVTSKLSRHRGHSFLWLREFDQQPGPFFAGFCLFWFHGSKSASVCQDDSGLMKATTLPSSVLHVGTIFVVLWSKVYSVIRSAAGLFESFRYA